MKKIIILHHSGLMGGAGVSCFNTAKLLSENYEVVIYCPSYPNDFYNFAKDNGIKVKTYSFELGGIMHYSGSPPIYAPGFSINLINMFKAKDKLRILLEEEKPDLLIANSKTLSWVSSITTSMKIKSICYVRETKKKPLKTGLWDCIHKSHLNKFDGVIFISNFDKNYEKLSKTNSYVVPNFIDEDFFSSVNKLDEEIRVFKVLYVGGMLRIKGIEHAIESLKYLKNYDIKLLIAGNPNFNYKKSNNPFNILYNFLKKRYEMKINNIVKNNQLENYIEKLGVVTDMRNVYNSADILIFPAISPHQARPAFEIGAFRKTVIMPDFINTQEYVKDYSNGLIYKAKSSRALAEKIEELLLNKELRHRLGEENYKHTIENHTKSTSSEKLKNAIKIIIKE